MPDINNPTTYAEWYWKNSMDASNALSEQHEKSYGPVIQQILSDSGMMEFIPDTLKPLYNILTEPSEPDWDDIQRFFLPAITRTVNLVAGEELARDFTYASRDKNRRLRIDAPTVSLLKQRKKITDELFLDRMHTEGYADSELEHYYNSRIPYPAIPDIISWARYAGEPTNPKALAWEKFDVSPTDWELWEWLSRMKLTTEQVQTLYKRGVLSTFEADTELARIGWQDLDLSHQKSLAYTVPNPMLMVQGGLISGTATETLLDDISKADIHPMYAETYLNAILTKPATEDIIAYELRRDPNLSALDEQLRRVGVHPNYNELYKELAYQIPPVADIITMAVREAFTPSIAARFGQYEGLPPDYVEWVQKKGLSKDWAERYWAAHWSLPSAQQGFEMLHRGVIGTDDLNLLLRASDIMPFWRDKLTQIAYRPLSRVDVRRMYKTGTLGRDGVYKAYTDLGYSPDNARLMTDFTIEMTRGSLRRFTSNDIINAYKRRFIGRGEASSLLRKIDTNETEISSILETADVKLTWENKKLRTSAIANLYKKGQQTETETVNELSGLGYPQDHINTLLERWQAKSKADKESLWTTAQTLKFFTSDLIDEARARQELIDIGYDAEHINVYIVSAKPVP